MEANLAMMTVLLNILSDEKFMNHVIEILEKYKQIKDVYKINVDDSNLNALAKGKNTEISQMIEEIRNTQGVRKVEAKVLKPL